MTEKIYDSKENKVKVQKIIENLKKDLKKLGV